MSGENVQIVREVCAAWERGDFSGFEWADPAIELVDDPAGPDSEVNRGIDGMRRAWRAWLRTWDGFRVRPQEFLDVGDEILVLVEFAGRGKASGVSVDALHTQGAARLHLR